MKHVTINIGMAETNPKAPRFLTSTIFIFEPQLLQFIYVSSLLFIEWLR